MMRLIVRLSSRAIQPIRIIVLIGQNVNENREEEYFKCTYGTKSTASTALTAAAVACLPARQ